jgi:uncharacterized protein (TIGR02466 family)
MLQVMLRVSGMTAKQYETNLFFPTPLWRVNIKEELSQKNLTVEDLVEECFQIEQIDKGRKVSNLGENAYQSNDLNFYDEKNKELKLYNLMEIVESFVQSIYKSIWVGNIVLGNAWININRKDALNTVHNHANSVLSGCIYLKTPENCGCLTLEKNFNEKFIFQSYGRLKEEQQSSLMFSEAVDLTVQEGDVLVFPAHVLHHVQPNKSEEERISISFNYGNLYI